MPARARVPVHVVPMPHVHRAALAVTLGGGPRVERDHEAGLTHLLEHMLFRGAGAHPTARALLGAFEDVGEEPDAFTTDDALTVVVSCAPERLGRVAGLVADVLLRPRYRDLEREREVVLEEWLGLVDEDDRLVDLDDVSRALAFPGHPAGRPVVGDRAAIERHGRAALERLRRRLVVAGNVAVAVAGPLDPRRAAAALAPLRAIPPGPRPVAPPLPPPAPAGAPPRTAWVPFDGAPQTDLRLTLRGPGPADPAWPALRALAGVLDGGPTSRLPERLVDHGLAYEAWADLAALPDAGLLEVHVSTAHDKLPRALERALGLLRGLARVDAAELARGRARRAHAARRRRDDPEDEAEWAARRLLLGLPLDRAAEDARVDAVTPAACAALARALVRPERLSAVLRGAPAAGTRRAARAALRRLGARPSTG